MNEGIGTNDLELVCTGMLDLRRTGRPCGPNPRQRDC